MIKKREGVVGEEERVEEEREEREERERRETNSGRRPLLFKQCSKRVKALSTAWKERNRRRKEEVKKS